MGYTFSPEESRALEEAGIFIGPSTNGWRRVNASILYPAHPTGIAQTSATLSSVTINYVNRPSDPSSQPTINLPEAEHSAAALEFMGFTRPAAEDILARWEERPDPERNNSTFLGYANADIGRLRAQPWKDLPPREAMTRVGIATKVQDVILDPSFANLFAGDTHYWVADTVRINRGTLAQFLGRLKGTAERILAEKNIEGET
jgi:hypothetical protein